MQISKEFDAGYEPIGELIKVIQVFFEERQNLYDKIAGTYIPVIEKFYIYFEKFPLQNHF